LVVEDQPVLATLGEHPALEVEGAHVEREAVHEDDGRLPGGPGRFDDLDVQLGAVGGGDGELGVERLVTERLVEMRIAGRVDRSADQCPLDRERGGQAGGHHTDRRPGYADLFGPPPRDPRGHAGFPAVPS
jgi:hypothetical protein